LDFNSEITRQLNLFTDAKNIDAKMPEGRKLLEQESARINGELSGIASIAALNIGVLDNNITFRQVQAAMQNKEMALENGKPILKNANGRTLAMTTNGVYLPIDQNSQPDNSAAPPPPAAPAPAPAPAPAASKVSNPRSVPTAQNPYASTRRAAIGGPFNEVDSNAIKNDLTEYQALLADNRPITKGRLKLLEQKLMAAGVIQ
jgi:hypothetical protein